MHDNHFFKPTPLYKEFMILDLIEKDANITQRKLSLALGASVSMINGYLEEYDKKGYIKRNYKSAKTVEYLMTKKGLERKKFLNISYLNATQQVYHSAKENIVAFLHGLSESGYKNILLYGAGEVAEILLQVIRSEKSNGVSVLGVIDDDASKQGAQLIDHEIISLQEGLKHHFDGILVSSYGHSDVILKKLKSTNIDKKKIIGFF